MGHAEIAKAVTVTELLAVAEALDALVTVTTALGATHKMQNRASILNRAGREFDEVTQMLVDRHLDVMGRLRSTQPNTEREIEGRRCALLRWDLQCDQDVTDAALIAVVSAFPDKF